MKKNYVVRIRLLLLVFSCILITPCILQAQTPKPNPSINIYRSTPEKTNDLIHTKLEITPDFQKQYVYGKAWITLKPHFYSTNRLQLDAKSMDIKQVRLNNEQEEQLEFNYKDDILDIQLPSTYNRNQMYTVYIEYTAKPNEKKVKGSAAIASDKGFYFINPLGKNPKKPIQVWTQGEPESSSVWFPTIDKPNQKTTQEIYITVPKHFVTLSNGLLKNQENKGKLRTDYWVMDKPHAPYLFFVGVGDYAIVKDTYRDLEVSYYVDQEYESVARQIFGETPAMIAFYEKLLGVDFPWSKYAQIVAHDYVSGAMENTTATLHMDKAQQNARQLVDGNLWEPVIAHEVFHHWFGNLVTTESFSNLTLNESFADYGEYLWLEHRYDKETADAHRYQSLQHYFANPKNMDKSLVRFYYNDKEDMFDAVSYNKGGAILHMLRSYVGDEAFFASLNHYLSQHQFKSAEVHDLRLSFEEVTGRDLNPFFNSWYFSSVQPFVDIKYTYMDEAKKVQLNIYFNATKGFIAPCMIDVHYSGGKVERKKHVLQSGDQSITIGYDALGRRPLWISVDADKTWVFKKDDHQDRASYLYQMKHGNFIDKMEALEYLSTHMYQSKEVGKVIFGVLKNGSRYIQEQILEVIREKGLDSLNHNQWNQIKRLAALQDQTHPIARSVAIDFLAKHDKSKKYHKFFEDNIQDSSYSVSGAALAALYSVDSQLVMDKYISLVKNDARGRLQQELFYIFCDQPTDEGMEYLVERYQDAGFYLQAYFSLCMSQYLQQDNINQRLAEKIIDGLYYFYTTVPANYSFLRNVLDGLKNQNKRGEGNPTLKGDILIYFREKFNF